MSIWDTEDFADEDSKEDFDPVDLLRESEVINELRSYNKDLIKAVTKPDMMLQILKLALTPTDSKEEEVIYRVPCNATEVLSSKVKDIEKALAKNSKEILPELMSYVKQDKLPGDIYSGYFSKIVSNYVRVAPKEFKEFLKSDNYLGYCLNHMDSFEVMDALRIMLDLPYKPKETTYWWNDDHKAVDQIVRAYEQMPKMLLNDKDNNNKDFYYINYTEFIKSLIQRSFTHLPECDIPSCHVLGEIFCQTDKLERILKVITDSKNKNKYQIAAGVAIFSRMLMRIQPDDLIGYGGEEALYYLPKMTLEERMHQGIVPTELVDTIVGFLGQHIEDFKPLFEIRNKEMNKLPALNQFKAPKVDRILLQLGYLFGNIGLMGNEGIYNEIHKKKVLKPIVDSFFYYNYNSLFHHQLALFFCKGIEILHDTFIIDLVSETNFVENSIKLHQENLARVYPSSGSLPKTSIPLLGHIYQIVGTVLIDGALMTSNGDTIESPPTTLNKTAIFLDACKKWDKSMEELIKEMKIRLYRKILSDEGNSGTGRKNTGFDDISDPLKKSGGNEEEFSFPDPLKDGETASFGSFGDAPTSFGDGGDDEGGFGSFGTFGAADGVGDDEPTDFGNFGDFGDA